MKNYIIVLALCFGVVVALQAQSENARPQDSTQTQETEQTQDAQPQENAQPQPEPSDEMASGEITDEELEKYAITMDSVNDMKETLLKEITAMVKGNEKMTNARYNELSKIADDEAALAKAKATPEEIAFIKDVAAKKEEGTAKIQETFQTMAKDFVGASSYNKIKKGLSSDPELQKRYQAQLEKLGADTGIN